MVRIQMSGGKAVALFVSKHDGNDALSFGQDALAAARSIWASTANRVLAIKQIRGLSSCGLLHARWLTDAVGHEKNLGDLLSNGTITLDHEDFRSSL